MSANNTPNRELISTNLNGYTKYLKGLGYKECHIGFLCLAPKLLFKLLGSYGCYDLITAEDYKLRFLDLIKSDYELGTLKKYKSGIKHFHDYLAIENIIPASKKECSPKKKALQVKDNYRKHRTKYYVKIERSFADYLQYERRYCADEIRKSFNTFQKFAAFLMENLIGTLKELVAKNVIEFFNLKSTHKTDRIFLKTFLKFIYREGHTPKNLAMVIIPNKKLGSKCKKYLKQKEVNSILSSLPRVTAWDKRNYAMFLLMSCLGLRPSETIRIRLKDIDWIEAKILVRGKNHTEDWLPLPTIVGKAIVDYLKVAPRGKTNFLFIKRRPPHSELKNTFPLSKALALAYETTGIKPPTGNLRLNVFRHSFATNLVNSNGANFYHVQAMMRHSTPSMTLHYAKYHSKKLNFFSVEWPEKKK